MSLRFRERGAQERRSIVVLPADGPAGAGLSLQPRMEHPVSMGEPGQVSEQMIPGCWAHGVWASK